MQNDLIIPPPIPFADETVGELEDAAKMFNVSLRVVEAEVKPVQQNPAGIYDRSYVPMGDAAVKLGPLYKAGDATAVASTLNDIRGILRGIIDAVESEDKKTSSNYHKAIAKFRAWLEDPVNLTPPSNIFVKGNVKLPFWSFSTLPGATCPGAGECLKADNGKRGWCYSFSAWRNIYPYFRQLQNTILIRMPNKDHILRDMRKKLKPGQAVRLYVDGDMDSVETIDFWMQTVRQFPQNEFYGYSKSWKLFNDWHEANDGDWPENYVLNLSSGTSLERIGGQMFRDWVAKMESLRNPRTGKALVRGRFVAVKINGKAPKRKDPLFKEKQRAYNIEVAEAAMKEFDLTKVFVCPGYCASCLGEGKHACGNRKMQDKIIAIGVH